MAQIITLFDSFNYYVAFMVFASYVLIDGFYAKYTIEVVALNPIRSANIGAFMHLLLAYWVINYTENWLYIFPLVLGSWIGTYYVVKNEKNKDA